MDSIIKYLLQNNKSKTLLRSISFVSSKIQIILYIYLIIVQYFQTDLKFFSMIICLLFVVLQVNDFHQIGSFNVPFYFILIFLLIRYFL